MKYVRYFSRLLLGVIFIFSGFVKAVDPLGSSYKFADYFEAFGLGFLEGIAVPLGIFLSVFELVLGITLIMGYRKHVVYWALLVFMSFFTLLTFILALFNPVTDCGCFGDALILTNWQTFLKNVGIMLFVIVLFFDREGEERKIGVVREWSLITIFFILVCWLSVWNLRHLPVMDFRPYDVGTIISEAMEIPDDAPMDEYETTLIYRNLETGKSESFTMQNYPKDTLTWAFEESDSKLISKGYEPPILDFAIMDGYGSELTDQILSDGGYSLLMISSDIGNADTKALVNGDNWARLEQLAEDFHFYPVTSSPTAEVADISVLLGLHNKFNVADDIMLKTMIRSNPGFILLKNGTIVGKWSHRDFPEPLEVNEDWPEMIGNLSSAPDEETLMLIEAGVFEDLSYNVVDFDHQANQWLHETGARTREDMALLLFIGSVIILIFLSRLFSPIKM